MKISNEFTVHTPIDKAWAVLTDLEGIAPCLPGAQLTGVDGDVYSGKVKIKVGPVISDFSGTARFVEKDDTAYRAVIDAKGKDSRSAGNASAVITAALRADGDSTVVSVDTDLKISGKLAQFGSGMIKEVSGKLLSQFAESLEAKIGAGDAAASPLTDEADAAGDGSRTVAVDEAGVMPAGAGLNGTQAADTSIAVASPGGESAAFPGEAQPVIKATPEVGGPSAAVDAGTPSPQPRPQPRTWTPREQNEPEPLDLMEYAGGSIRRRLIPVAVGAAVLVAAVVVYRVARR
jgi:carbon monoxide dehydrogenase subunit G